MRVEGGVAYPYFIREICDPRAKGGGCWFGGVGSWGCLVHCLGWSRWTLGCCPCECSPPPFQLSTCTLPR